LVLFGETKRTILSLLNSIAIKGQTKLPAYNRYTNPEGVVLL
jgi:hypothetical protein